MNKPRKARLKTWNGLMMMRVEGKRTPQLHVSICAYSQKDAIDLLREHGHRETLYEFRGWWSSGWGNSMDGIEPERGMWVEYEFEVPTRVFPKEKK